MSQVTEKAREEAERVEREEAEERARQEAAEEAPVELTGVAEEGPSDEQVAAMTAENERHLEALRAIMGPAAGLFEECRHCEGVGLAPRGPEPQQLDRYRTCPTCQGFAFVLTGAQETATWQVACPSCGGRGFQEKQTAAEGAQVPMTAPAAPAEEWGVPAWMGDPNIAPQPSPPLQPVPPPV